MGSVACATDDVKVVAVEQAPPEAVSEAVGKLLSPTAFKVTSGKRTVCEIWLAKQWAAKAGFKPTTSLLYPFEMGELMGVIRYPRKAGDFRGQEIASGVYTLRYALQPEDGNHVGTSPTRDFLLLSAVGEDSEPKLLDKETLFKLSKEAAQTTHPAMLCLLSASDPIEGDLPTAIHDEARELWSVRLAGKAEAGGKASDQPLQIVVIGQAAE